MAKERMYRDFMVELRGFDETTGTYEVALPPTPEYGEPDPVSASLDYDQIETDLGDLEAKQIYIEDLIPLGQRLMDRLLPEGPLRQHMVAAIKNAKQDEGVRLRLLIRDARLAQLPWEYCYLRIAEGQQDRNHFMVVNPKISLVRHVPLDAQLPEIRPADPKHLRMLPVMANPESTAFRPLHLKTERRVIEKALGEFSVEGVTIQWQPFLENVTETALDAALAQKPDLFHFAGHGQFKEHDAVGSIILVEDAEKRAPFSLPAESLATKLAAAGVRLAVLGACESSRQRGVTPWTAIAPALVASGLPVVLAMQYEVLDDFAILFSQAFYTSLAAGLSVDEAVSAGRLAMLNKSSDKGVEWGVPTLYMRAMDGTLFPEVKPESTKSADGLRLALEHNVDVVEHGGVSIGLDVEGLLEPGEYCVKKYTKVVKGTDIGVKLRNIP